MRDARRGGGRAELRAGEGPGKGKPRHVEKTRHSSSGVLRTRVRAQVQRETFRRVRTLVRDVDFVTFSIQNRAPDFRNFLTNVIVYR